MDNQCFYPEALLPYGLDHLHWSWGQAGVEVCQRHCGPFKQACRLNKNPTTLLNVEAVLSNLTAVTNESLGSLALPLWFGVYRQGKRTCIDCLGIQHTPTCNKTQQQQHSENQGVILRMVCIVPSCCWVVTSGRTCLLWGGNSLARTAVWSIEHFTQSYMYHGDIFFKAVQSSLALKELGQSRLVDHDHIHEVL